jgi:PAT family beta-lactamase induction signal transducer AmpG
VAGAVAGGFVMDRLGDQKALWISMLAVALTLALLAVAALSLPVAFILAILFGIAYGASQAVYFALAMKYTQPTIAASMYSILMAVTNVGQGIGLGLSGALAKGLGFPPAFLIFAGLVFLILPFFPLVFGRSKAATVA